MAVRNMLQAIFLLAAIAIYGSSGQAPTGPIPPTTPADTCGPVQQFSRAGFVCAFPQDCCTRLLCTLSFLLVDAADFDIRVNPCTVPATLDILVYSGGSTIFNMSGISTSQTIPIQYGGVLDTSVDLFFNSTMNSVTLGLSAFGLEIVPPTVIDISDPGCSAGSMAQPPACFPTPPPATVGPSMSPAVSDGTCQALQQLAGSGNIGINPNNCFVTNRCTTVSCNYLGLFPIALTLLSCNNPPGIQFVAYNETNGGVVFNETVTDSRRIALDDLGADSAIIVNINHPCGQDAIIVEVIFSTIFNSTILPPTTIPIDRSDCTMVEATITPCMEAPTNFGDLCDAVQSSFQSTASTCTTNFPDCTTTTCDLNEFSLPITWGYTLLPCTEVPSIRVNVMNNGTVLVDETLTNSRVETFRVGPTNVSVRFIVNQSPPDFKDIQVGVNLISTEPAIDVPVFPVTIIPLDRCACDEITCPTPPLIVVGVATNGAPPSPDGATTDGATTDEDPNNVGNPGANAGGTTGLTPVSGGDIGVIVPAAIAAVLFVALVVVVAGAIAALVIIKKRHNQDLKSVHESVSYKNLSANNEDTR